MNHNTMEHPLHVTRQAWPMLSLLLGLLAVSAPGFAADGSPTQACRDDVRKHCSAVKPGGGRALACLEQHESELSASCQAALPTLKRCGQEMKALCGDSSPRETRSCLRSNADKLSAECRSLSAAR